MKDQEGSFSPVAGHHWLLSWMNEFDVQNGEQALERARFPGALQRLYDLAKKENETYGKYVYQNSPSSIVGGSGLDLGERGSVCGHPECRTKFLDRELIQILHYFDYIVMEGPSSQEYVRAFEDGGEKSVENLMIYKLDWDVESLSYARRSGAVDYTYFIPKPNAFCQSHFTVHAQELGVAELADLKNVRELARKIAREGSVRIQKSSVENRWSYKIVHPSMGELPLLIMSGKSAPPRHVAVETVLRDEISNMVSDLAASKMLGVPLAAAVRPAVFGKGNGSSLNVTVDQVAARLQIPFIEGLRAYDFLKLREESWEEFARFRASLTVAIKESVEKAGDASPDEIATKVRRDFIEPAIADIVRKLKANRKLTIIKSAAGLSVGAAVAAVGSLTAMPLLLAAGVTAAATPLAQVYKHFDDKRDIELSDCYFLWKAARVSDH